MATLTDTSTQCKYCGGRAVLDENRAQWLLDHLKLRSDLYLDGATYRFMSAMYGFSKKDLDRAISTLHARGLVRVDGLWVEVVEEPSCPAT